MVGEGKRNYSEQGKEGGNADNYNKGPRRDDKYGLARVKYTGNLIPARSLDTRKKGHRVRM